MKAADTLLGFDFGARRIGVAVGNRRLGNARALRTIHCHGEPDWTEIEKLVSEWAPEALIVGVPLTMAGESQPATVGAQKFMRQLRQRFHLPVHGAEERMTTMAAESLLRDQRSSGKRRRRAAEGEVDNLAAQLILEDWMNSHRGVAAT